MAGVHSLSVVMSVQWSMQLCILHVWQQFTYLSPPAPSWLAALSYLLQLHRNKPFPPHWMFIIPLSWLPNYALFVVFHWLCVFLLWYLSDRYYTYTHKKLTHTSESTYLNQTGEKECLILSIKQTFILIAPMIRD